MLLLCRSNGKRHASVQSGAVETAAGKEAAVRRWRPTPTSYGELLIFVCGFNDDIRDVIIILVIALAAVSHTTTSCISRSVGHHVITGAHICQFRSRQAVAAGSGGIICQVT